MATLEHLEAAERALGSALAVMREWSQKAVAHLRRSELQPVVNSVDNARATIRLVRLGEPVREYIPPALRKEVYRRDKGKCQRCGVSVLASEAEVDHLVAVSRGGPSTLDNLRILCRPCNREKASALPYGGLGEQAGLGL